jgi:hypothetical protein
MARSDSSDSVGSGTATKRAPPPLPKKPTLPAAEAAAAAALAATAAASLAPPVPPPQAPSPPPSAPPPPPPSAAASTAVAHEPAAEHSQPLAAPGALELALFRWASFRDEGARRVFRDVVLSARVGALAAGQRCTQLTLDYATLRVRVEPEGGARPVEAALQLS